MLSLFLNDSNVVVLLENGTLEILGFNGNSGIPNKLLDMQEVRIESDKITCVKITKQFLVYGTLKGIIRHFMLDESLSLLNEMQHDVLITNT